MVDWDKWRYGPLPQRGAPREVVRTKFAPGLVEWSCGAGLGNLYGSAQGDKILNAVCDAYESDGLDAAKQTFADHKTRLG